MEKHQLNITPESNFDELPPLSRFEDEKDFRQEENSSFENSAKPEQKEEINIKAEIMKAQSINELLGFLSGEMIKNMPNGANLADQIQKLNDFYRVNSTSVIVGEMISEKMEEKDSAAQEFARLFQEIQDPYGFGLKEKTKELLKAEMKSDFQTGSLEYARMAIEKSCSITQLKRVVGYFNRLKAKGLNGEKTAYFTGQDINFGIDNALDYINRLLDFQGLADKDELHIRGEIDSALMTVPDDDLGIKEKCRDLFYDFVISKKSAGTKKLSFFSRFSRKFFGNKEAA